MSKKDKLYFYCILIIISGVFGWIYEVLFYFANSGFKFWYGRGVCFLPWIDIYAIGGILIYLLNRKDTKSKIKVFIKSGLICGITEYIAGLGIYLLFDGKRSWDYNTEILNFGNIQGFVCLRSVLVFATCGLLIMYIIAPLIKKILANKKIKKIIGPISVVICSILFIDEFYNQTVSILHLNLIRGKDLYEKLGFKFMSYK